LRKWCAEGRVVIEDEVAYAHGQRGHVTSRTKGF
jgi:hypothetical protein